MVMDLALLLSGMFWMGALVGAGYLAGLRTGARRFEDLQEERAGSQHRANARGIKLRSMKITR
jgi:hypothetical protein